ncbi:MAG TPA: glycosyltransferase [Cellvibrionaceae bacterium]
MITANFYNIKSTNGLYFYGLDYLRESLSVVRLVLVRPFLKKHIQEALPGVKVVVCSTSRFAKEIVIANLRGDLLFTPTSHPLPGINRQWIVLHDAYPFEIGPRAGLKYMLFRISLCLSRCRVGYINRSDAKLFLEKMGVTEERMVFAPNRFPDAIHHAPAVIAPLEGITTVGLLGTDSAKKNYDLLFSAVRRAGLSADLVFHVYGHETPYFRKICAQFRELNIQLVKSDYELLEVFLSRVDVLASAAEQEGFGRPIAAALLAGVPVELLDRPVFREFFSGGARFHSEVDMLVKSLPRSGTEQLPLSYKAPADVVAAYIAANNEIRRVGSIGLR